TLHDLGLQSDDRRASFAFSAVNCSSLFFFLLPRRPPRSPLFPYPTLFRSGRRGEGVRRGARARHRDLPRRRPPLERRGRSRCRRSEEHTSELQSLRHLVCRLLLEKKKKT